jgi:hypothetical protein
VSTPAPAWLEGIVSKRWDRTYKAGRNSRRGRHPSFRSLPPSPEAGVLSGVISEARFRPRPTRPASLGAAVAPLPLRLASAATRTRSAASRTEAGEGGTQPGPRQSCTHAPRAQALRRRRQVSR